MVCTPRRSTVAIDFKRTDLPSIPGVFLSHFWFLRLGGSPWNATKEIGGVLGAQQQSYAYLCHAKYRGRGLTPLVPRCAPFVMVSRLSSRSLLPRAVRAVSHLPRKFPLWLRRYFTRAAARNRTAPSCELTTYDSLNYYNINSRTKYGPPL